MESQFCGRPNEEMRAEPPFSNLNSLKGKGRENLVSDQRKGSNRLSKEEEEIFLVNKKRRLDQGTVNGLPGNLVEAAGFSEEGSGVMIKADFFSWKAEAEGEEPGRKQARSQKQELEEGKDEDEDEDQDEDQDQAQEDVWDCSKEKGSEGPGRIFTSPLSSPTGLAGKAKKASYIQEPPKYRQNEDLMNILEVCRTQVRQELRSNNGGRKIDGIYNLTLMDGERGGRAYLTERGWKDFLSIVNNSVQQGNEINFSMTEYCKPHFRAFFDVDFTLPEVCSQEVLDLLFVSLQLAVVHAFTHHLTKVEVERLPPHLFLCHILTSSSIRKIRQTSLQGREEDGYKYGAHLIFPNLYVTKGMMIALRSFVLYQIRLFLQPENQGLKEAGLNPFVMIKATEENWASILDGEVYHKENLRLPYAKKVKEKTRKSNGQTYLIKHWTNAHYQYYTSISGYGVLDDLSPVPKVEEFCLNFYKISSNPLDQVKTFFLPKVSTPLCFTGEVSSRMQVVMKDCFQHLVKRLAAILEVRIPEKITQLQVAEANITFAHLIDICSSERLAQRAFGVKPPEGEFVPSPINPLYHSQEVSLSGKALLGEEGETVSSLVSVRKLKSSKGLQLGNLASKGASPGNDCDSTGSFSTPNGKVRYGGSSRKKPFQACFGNLEAKVGLANLPKETEVMHCVQGMFPKFLVPMYRSLEILQLEPKKDGSYYVLKVMGPHSQYCINKGDSHGSSSIYFIIGPSQIQQRCFSSKTPPSGSTQCKKFSAVVYLLTNRESRILFPFRETTSASQYESVKKGNPLLPPELGHDPFANLQPREKNLFKNMVGTYRKMSESSSSLPKPQETSLSSPTEHYEPFNLEMSHSSSSGLQIRSASNSLPATAESSRNFPSGESSFSFDTSFSQSSHGASQEGRSTSFKGLVNASDSQCSLDHRENLAQPSSAEKGQNIRGSNPSAKALPKALGDAFKLFLEYSKK